MAFAHKKLRVGVIGVGYLGKEHARIYRDLPETDLVGISDIDPSKEEKAKELGVSFFKDFRGLIGQIEAVSIATPTSIHYEAASACLKQGVHTLIEKPITADLKDADELIRLAQAKNLALQVGHLERYNAGFRHIEKMVKNVRFLEIHRLSPFTPRIKDCGVVLDMMIHDLDILLQLIKSTVKSIDCVGINVLTKFEDIANVRIRFDNGAVADVTASRLTPEKQRKIRIFQEDAYISLDYQAQSAQVFRKGLMGIKKETVTLEKEESLKAELEDFVRSILNKRALGKPDIQARNALALALEITAAIKKNENTAVTVHV
ncbi:MAG: hypothetical protein COV74_01080 [Candidatus Omnitrophica bacterium CG11_big_fil_rev_8_21_14_0_20_45_26]|uniref:Uncharacterized protein n=1 Tax=Candidatus Abzuiibacterium crystallinum TaxID=1974748 RepID=A0A2H0LV59_9BACT|nr:MAG: hypothetical protein COV74_01080 [Candidatus Omnitrophica bacterium CG11_big_fil_rev_8_21_14_0_20_45_26]PIW64172.1 MAG: hypothetical protein COW12_07340 [Candidatus Omnitrophica bacterium CG12_big_fil_rev_8_21_14_0_65_45_16]